METLALVTRCLWFQGWEGGEDRSLASPIDDLQNSWATGGTHADKGVSTTTPRSGKYKTQNAIIGLNDTQTFVGDYRTLSENFITYSFCFQFNGLTTETGVVGDQYIVVRMVSRVGAGGSGTYLAIILKLQSATAGSETMRIQCAIANESDDTLTAGVVLNHTTDISKSSTVWHECRWVVDTVNDTGTFFLDDDAGSTANPNNNGDTPTYNEEMIPQSILVVRAKSDDDGPLIWWDDWSVWESDSAANAPSDAQLDVWAVQPNAEGSVSDWSGRWQDWDDFNDDCPGEFRTPTATIGDEQYVDFVDPDAGTPLAAALVWNGVATNAHTGRGTVDGAMLDLSTANGAGQTATPTGTNQSHMHGCHLWKTPKATPGDWTNADIDAFEGGLETNDTNQGIVHQVGLQFIGSGYSQTAATVCPPFIPRVSVY